MGVYFNCFGIVLLLNASVSTFSSWRDQDHLEKFAAVTLDKALILISEAYRFKVGALALDMAGFGAGTAPTETHG